MATCYNDYIASINGYDPISNLTRMLGQDIEDYYSGKITSTPPQSYQKYVNSIKQLFTNTGTKYINDTVLNTAITNYLTKCYPAPTKYVPPSKSTGLTT